MALKEVVDDTESRTGNNFSVPRFEGLLAPVGVSDDMNDEKKAEKK